MTDNRRLAARLTADRLAELEQALDAERSSAAPDWDNIEALSQEAAALLVPETDMQDGQQALLSAIAQQQQKPPVRFFRLGLYASAAAVAGIAVFLVPAVIRMRHAVKPQPPAVQTETTTYTNTALSAEITATVTSHSQTGTQTETVPTETETAVTATTTVQSAVTTTASGTTTLHTGMTETTKTTPSTRQTATTATEQSRTHTTETSASSTFTGSEYTTATTNPDVTEPGPYLQTVYFRTVDEADPSQAVAGAEMQLYDMNGNLVLHFRSGSSPVQAELALYTQYRLHAVSVPEGWQLPRRDLIIQPDSTYFDIPLRSAKEETP